MTEQHGDFLNGLHVVEYELERAAIEQARDNTDTKEEDRHE